jgi:cell wall-associated NlpC family hydrolase
MPVHPYHHHRRKAVVRAVFDPGLLMMYFILLATVVAVSSVVAHPPRQRRTFTVFPTDVTGTTVQPSAFLPGSAGAKLIPSPTWPPPSPTGNPAVNFAPAAPPVPPVAFNATGPDLPAPPAAVQKPVAAAPSSGGAAAVAYALRQLGKPYVYGAAGDSAFDCSGLVMRAWQAGGVWLPRTTYEMARTGSRITRDQLRPGDLVFLYNYGHVTLYIGDGNMVEAPHAGAVVRIRPLPSGVDAYVRVG